jgi:heterotetrameric sarcosine oxidase delta subunit
MFLIACPHCGPRAQAEFAYERSLDSIVDLDAPADVAMAALYTRANPRGLSRELWRHGFGCRAWLVVERDTGTHVIKGVTAWGAEP